MPLLVCNYAIESKQTSQTNNRPAIFVGKKFYGVGWADDDEKDPLLFSSNTCKPKHTSQTGKESIIQQYLWINE